MDINKRIVELRKKANIKPSAFAKIAGISQSYYSEIESGKAKVPIDTLNKVCTALGITLQEFFSIEKNSLADDFPEGIQYLKRAAKELTPESKKRFVEIMKIFLEETKKK